MIPPVEERSVRPCTACICYLEEEGESRCKIDMDAGERYNPPVCYSRIGVIQPDALNDMRCEYHVTPIEYRKLRIFEAVIHGNDKLIDFGVV